MRDPLKTLGLALALATVAAPAFAQPAAEKAAGLLSRFDREPTVNQTQQAALDYAKLHPEIYESMATRSRLRGLLPEVRLRVTKDDDEESRSVARFDQAGVAGERTGYDTLADDLQFMGEARWRLGDVVFNNQETAVARENRYGARERRQLLQTVTQIYFERRRAQIELVNSPPKDPTARALADLKIQQLTGELDAMTGGRFSRLVANGGQPLPIE
ncbi:MAG: hypothetical protein H6702_08120 [Myxococcales bacterium]|nr:hypothetical protein [Myxococcales bacterium]